MRNLSEALSTAADALRVAAESAHESPEYAGHHHRGSDWCSECSHQRFGSHAQRCHDCHSCGHHASHGCRECERDEAPAHAHVDSDQTSADGDAADSSDSDPERSLPPPYPPYPPMPPYPAPAPYPPFPPYPPYVIIAAGSGCGCTAHGAGAASGGSPALSTYLVPDAPMTWATSAPAAVNEPTPKVPPSVGYGASAARPAAMTLDMGQGFPDPATLTNLDALLALGENAVEMVNQIMGPGATEED